MKDPQDKQTVDMLRKPQASRQARYREKREAEGYRQVAVWIHQDSEEAGATAADKGAPCDPGSNQHDPLSWAIGWVKAKYLKK
ncbi:hypothetical protein [Stutzerimonas kunmingensis]|uniref:hypothetical protein n=1 Tax=Stutzerimonas kunmingensis TaxID=1211807 RepID=UPI0028B0C8F8|nr:hypothetical protein [Stutzerimonas kunmingensis]